MISTAERRRPARLLAVLALALAASPGGAVDGAAARLASQAQAALSRGDGVAAEIALRKAMAAGLPREAAAARMGEAYIDQRDRKKAREWLGPGRFAPGEDLRGFRLLGQLELADGNLAAAGMALDRALALAPTDSGLWLDIARLRYAGGEHLQSIEAADRAVQLDPSGARALQYRGLLVRDRFGLAAGLPWFEAGLKNHPDDLGLLAEYAATLGETGRVKELLTVTRRIIEIDRGNGPAYFFQAVVAARAGDGPLARTLLARAGPDVAGRPAALLLGGILALEAGNNNHAVDLLGRLSRLQPQNRTARMLLARAMAAAGARRQLVEIFSAEAQRADASPYLLTLLGRAYEDLGRRDLAAPLLDRAARAGMAPVLPLAETVPLGVLAVRQAEAPGLVDAAVPYVRALLAAGRAGEAASVAERLLAQTPGSADSHLLAGDVRLARGDLSGAIAEYRLSAAVRLGDELMLRLVDAYGRSGRLAEANELIARTRATMPRNRAVIRAAATFAASRGSWAEAATLLDWLVRSGSGNDARVQADRAFAWLKAGNRNAAADAARRAYAVQRSSVIASEVMALVLAQTHPARRDSAAFAGKVRSLSR